MESAQLSKPNPGPPLTVEGARIFLVLCLAAWAIGTFSGARHFLEGTRDGETGAELVDDILTLSGRVVLLCAAGFALWATQHRLPAGRWVTVALASIVCYRLLPSLLYSCRAMGGDLTTPDGLVGYASPDEAKRAFAINFVLLCVLAAQTLLLAVGSAAARYFVPLVANSTPPTA